MLSSVVARGPDIIAGGSDLVALGSGGCGGAGFDLADVTSDRLELFAVLAGAGAEGSVFVAKGSDIIAGGSDLVALGSGGCGGAGFDCAGAGGSVFVAKGSDIIALGSVGCDVDLVVVCAGSEDSVFAALGFDAGVESGGIGFDLAEVTSVVVGSVALGGGGCCGAGRSLIVFSRAATGSLASLAF